MESKEASVKAKQFNPPSEGHSGLYVYRDSFVGQALKKDIWIDGKCIGESAPDVFFYEEVKSGQQHTISTESEFSPNDLTINTLAGANYFINQYIKLGVFVGGAGLELVDEEKGKNAIIEIGVGQTGHLQLISLRTVAQCHTPARSLRLRNRDRPARGNPTFRAFAL